MRVNCESVKVKQAMTKILIISKLFIRTHLGVHDGWWVVQRLGQEVRRSGSEIHLLPHLGSLNPAG